MIALRIDSDSLCTAPGDRLAILAADLVLSRHDVVLKNRAGTISRFATPAEVALVDGVQGAL